MTKSPKFSEIVGIDPDMLLFITREAVEELFEIDPVAAELLIKELEEVHEVLRSRRLH